MLNHIYKNFNIDKLEEVTIEANPGTLNKEKLRIYKKSGINRISMGVQSLNDRLLKEIGRSHTSVDFYRNYELIKKIGFKNVNVDLMFGLPYQDLKDLQNTLEQMVSLGVEHISYYSLILEKGTLMYRWHNQGKIKIPDEEVEREMYHRGIEFLKDKDYNHYEISNFSKCGLECKHNLIYWQINDYIGFGMAAHYNLNQNRFWNYTNFNNYYDNIDERKPPIEGIEKIDRKMEIAEYLIMGLRLIEGISKKDFIHRFHVRVEDIYGDVLKKYQNQYLLYIDEQRIKFTSRGLDLSNIVYLDLLTD